MRIMAIEVMILSLMLLTGCVTQQPEQSHKKLLAKETLNPQWRKQGVSPDSWYYRMTVIDAPPNSRAMGVGEGHFLHPEVIKWEITRDLLIGWRTHASVLNADLEQEAGNALRYKGAPVVVFAISEHSDEDESLPWYERRYLKVDWTHNLVMRLQRHDGEDGISSQSLENSATHSVDESDPGNPKRMRFGANFVDVTVRYPVTVSRAYASGIFGPTHKGDLAATVIDIRHFFMKKPSSDFVPISYPDSVVEKDSNGQPILDDAARPKRIAINNRFGFVRTNFDGRRTYNRSTGSADGPTVINAAIFNIWDKSRDAAGTIIPLEKRTVKPIIYYTNVLHPESLMNASLRVGRQWDMALRNAVFRAQPGKYRRAEEVPAMWILKRNSCNLANVKKWLTHTRPDLKNGVEEQAEVRVSEISAWLLKAALGNFSIAHRDEMQALLKLERICSALEFYTEQSSEPFVYQRAGDLRFNLLNLDPTHKHMGWSGYGPMFADPFTGETISATANINLKYIDQKAHVLSTQIGLLHSKTPGLSAVFGGQTESFMPATPARVNFETLASIREHVMRNTNTRREFVSSQVMHEALKKVQSFSPAERAAIGAAQKVLLQSEAGEQTEHARTFHGTNTTKSRMLAQVVLDPVDFVDDLTLGSALSFAHLSEQERFLKIREAIYEGIALHQIGHNLGLKHNMAGSSDALNYGEAFWHNEQLPNEPSVALQHVKDAGRRRQLQTCIRNAEQLMPNLNSLFASKKITTQDCLQQQTSMHASIMDYHASTLANMKGLGHYDKAAINWAYGQVVEVFPKESLLVNLDKIELAHWLRLNDYRRIPHAMLKSVAAINERAYEKVQWDNDTSFKTFPKNAVPYAYCDDATSNGGPRCLAYDVGPDMQSSAQWLSKRYWQQFLLTHFTGNKTVDGDLVATMRDIDTLTRYTNMVRWYYHQAKTNADFIGSYAEQDYLSAIAIGLNHFVHVIGLPESGTHLSAPNFVIEESHSLPIDSKRLLASPLLVPFNGLTYCNARSFTKTNEAGDIVGRFGYTVVDVPLGLGRPYYPRSAEGSDGEELVYSGSMLVKKFALLLLAAPLEIGRSLETVEKNDLLSMTWYRMFPEAVGKIFDAVISKNYGELGPIIAADKSLHVRDVIDEKTLEIKNYQTQSVMPALDDSLALFAAQVAITFIPATINHESNLIKSMEISCQGCSDEVSFNDVGDGMRTVTFEHLSGEKYSVPKFSDHVSIGARLLQKANQQKERFIRLEQCIESDEVRMKDPFCGCVKVMERRTFDDWQCCEEENTDCEEPLIELVGNGVCSLADLKKRQLQSKDQLDSMVGFIDSIRKLIKNPGI